MRDERGEGGSRGGRGDRAGVGGVLFCQDKEDIKKKDSYRIRAHTLRDKRVFTFAAFPKNGRLQGGGLSHSQHSTAPAPAADWNKEYLKPGGMAASPCHAWPQEELCVGNVQ